MLIRDVAYVEVDCLQANTTDSSLKILGVLVKMWLIRVQPTRRYDIAGMTLTATEAKQDHEDDDDGDGDGGSGS